jgi:hypothetical protein
LFVQVWRLEVEQPAAWVRPARSPEMFWAFYKLFSATGVETTLTRLNLAEYVGRPLEDVFLALT